MKLILIIAVSLVVKACAYKNIGEYGPNTAIIDYEELPSEVKSAYQNEFDDLINRSLKSPLPIINIDLSHTEFYMHKSTSVAIINPGKIIYKIGTKKFYLPWNRNREMHPRVLYNKNIYMLFAPTGMEKLNYYMDDNHKKMKYFKVDLSKHLKY